MTLGDLVEMQQQLLGEVGDALLEFHNHKCLSCVQANPNYLQKVCMYPLLETSSQTLLVSWLVRAERCGQVIRRHLSLCEDRS